MRPRVGRASVHAGIVRTLLLRKNGSFAAPSVPCLADHDCVRHNLVTLMRRDEGRLCTRPTHPKAVARGVSRLRALLPQNPQPAVASGRLDAYSITSSARAKS